MKPAQIFLYLYWPHCFFDDLFGKIFLVQTVYSMFISVLLTGGLSTFYWTNCYVSLSDIIFIL